MGGRGGRKRKKIGIEGERDEHGGVGIGEREAEGKSNEQTKAGGKEAVGTLVWLGTDAAVGRAAGAGC